MTLDDFGFLGRAARVVLEVFTLWKDHVDALVASSAGSKREGCHFAAVRTVRSSCCNPKMHPFDV